MSELEIELELRNIYAQKLSRNDDFKAFAKELISIIAKQHSALSLFRASETLRLTALSAVEKYIAEQKEKSLPIFSEGSVEIEFPHKGV
jgi:hypothetical protein